MNKYATSGLTKSIISLFLVLLPSLVIWFYFSKDWGKTPIVQYKYVWLIAIGFILLTIIISWICVLSHIAWYDLFNFTFPIAVLFMIILVTYLLSNWTRALIVIPSIILVTLPVNMVVTRITDNQINKDKIKFHELHS